MSFPSLLLPRGVAFAHLSSASSSLRVPSISSNLSFARSVSLSDVFRGPFSNNASPSSRRQSRSYASPPPKPTSKRPPPPPSPSKPTAAKIYTPRQIPKKPTPPGSSSSSPSSSSTPSFVPSVTHTYSSSYYYSTPNLAATQRRYDELLAKGDRLPTAKLTVLEHRELSALKKEIADDKIIQDTLATAKINNLEPMSGREGPGSESEGLKRWFEEVGKKNLNKTGAAWKEFVILPIPPFLKSEEAAMKDATVEAKVDGRVGCLISIGVTLTVTAAMYFLAAVATDRTAARAEVVGTSPWILGPWGGWIAVTSLFFVACAIPHYITAVASGKIRVGGRINNWIRKKMTDDPMDNLRWYPPFRSYYQVWSSMLVHSGNPEFFGNLAFFTLYGFFAYSFFDDRSSIEKKEWIWPYIRDFFGWPNESPTASPPRTGAFHFLVFALTAAAFSCAVFCQIRSYFFVWPRAEKTLRRIIQNPTELQSIRPQWHFVSTKGKVWLSNNIMNEFGGHGSGGLSIAVSALQSLSILNMTFVSWNPVYIPVQLVFANFLREEFRLVHRHASPAGPFGHLPGVMFGVIYFFFGGYVWDWFLERAGSLRGESQNEVPSSIALDPVDASLASAKKDDEEETSPAPLEVAPPS